MIWPSKVSADLKYNFVIFMIIAFVLLLVSPTFPKHPPDPPPLPTNCTMPSNLSCPDFTSCPNNASILFAEPNVTYTCNVVIPSTFTTINLQSSGTYANLTINSSNVFISGNLTVPGSLNITYENMQLNDSFVSVGGIVWLSGMAVDFPQGLYMKDAAINASQLVLYSSSIVALNNSNITTSAQQCTQQWTGPNGLNPAQFLDFSYNTNIFSATVNLTTSNLTQTMYSISLNTSLAILTSSLFGMLQTNIQTSVFFLVASLANITGGAISTSGCSNGEGAGNGLNVVTNQSGVACGSSGASSSGYGGYGTAEQTCEQNVRFFQFVMHSFPYGLLENPLVTGSSGSNPNGLCWGTTGGGVIAMLVAQVLDISGVLNTSGSATNGPLWCSAGSAGSINILTNNLTGSGTIVGAGGSAYGNSTSGEGSGGWMKIYSLQDASLFTGVINLNSGSRSVGPVTANPGTLYYMNCQAGFGPRNPSQITVACAQCPPNTYKGFMDINCQSCKQYPGLQFNQGLTIPTTTINQCYKDTDKMKEANMIDLKGFVRGISFLRIVIFNGLIIVCVCFGIILKKIYKKKKSRLETDSFDFEKETQDMNSSRIITEKLKNDREFKMADLMYHIHRITVFGANTYGNPWMLSENPPEELQGIIVADNYQIFVKNLNNVLKWTKMETYLLYPCFIIYPLYWFLLIHIKKKKYKAVVKYIEQTKINFINKELHQDKNFIKIKVSKNTDYTICYLDIFRYNKADMKYFMLSCPYIVYLSGQGNFIRPFYLCETDPFLNVLYFIINRNIEKSFDQVYQRTNLMSNLFNQKKRLQNSSKLAKFVRHFNRGSCTLDLNSPTEKFINGVIILIDLLTEWNKEFFNKFSVQMNLILIISKFDGNRIVDHQVTILERTEELQFQKWMETAINGLQMVDKYDIKFAIFIYNPNQDLDDFLRERNRQIVQIADRTDKSHALSFKQTITAQDPLLDRSQSSASTVQLSSKCSHKFFRILGFIRYSFISHRTSTTSKYVLQFFQIVLILFEASFVAVWQRWLTYPYVGVDIIVPFVGIVWIASGNSYGVGKVFLILNAMAFINEVTEVIIVLAMWETTSWTAKILRLVTLVLQLGIIGVGCRMITYSKKLNQPKVT